MDSPIIRSLLSIFILTAILYAFSSSKRTIPWKLVGAGILLQVVLAYIFLKTSWGSIPFQYAKYFFEKLLGFANVGGTFVFGDLARIEKVGFVIATMVVPPIIFVSLLMSVLYHLGIMQMIIRLIGYFIKTTMGTTAAESLAQAANIFCGQTEAPLVVRPYLNKMSESEILALMTGGMATASGGTLAAYVGLGIDAGHLLCASILSAPAALVCAKILIPPHTQENVQNSSLGALPPSKHLNIIDAAASGALDGLYLALNVMAVLMAFVSLVALVNYGLTSLGSVFGLSSLTFETLTGFIFAPIAYLLGASYEDAQVVGFLFGKKLILNEFVAYLDLSTYIKNNTLSPLSVVVATYGLCGFANFSSVAIQIGGLSTLCPERRESFARLGLKSLLAGTVACFLTAAVAALFS